MKTMPAFYEREIYPDGAAACVEESVAPGLSPLPRGKNSGFLAIHLLNLKKAMIESNVIAHV